MSSQKRKKTKPTFPLVPTVSRSGNELSEKKKNQNQPFLLSRLSQEAAMSAHQQKNKKEKQKPITQGSGDKA